MDVNDMRIHVAFRGPDGSLICREVTALSIISGTEEQVDIDAGSGVAFGIDDSLCWLDLCRLASDTVDWTWHGIGKASVSAPMVRVTQ
jgi:hypothetical protein